MNGDLDLPIAVRRSRRSNVTNSSKRDASPLPDHGAQTTPDRKSRPKKRVRFSDPGPVSGNGEDEPQATGLTPMIRRATLSSRTQRRCSTPAKRTRLGHEGSGNGSGALSSADRPGTPFSGEVHGPPLCQVLDSRLKRRIRRNGLSEEMNTMNAEKRRRKKETEGEIARLKALLVEKDEEILRLHDETVVLDSDRVWELEQQVETLKKQLADKSGPQDMGNSSPAYNWTVAARDPFSRTSMEVDDGDFGDATMAELACSTPTRRARASFPTPPATSPMAVMLSPCSDVFTRRSDSGAQASLPDPEKQELEHELASLQLEACKLTATLESYTGMASRLADKLSSVDAQEISPATTSSPHPELEAKVAILLRTLSDRTAALLELNSSLSSLGFPGSDASEIVVSLAAAFRTARLELEYLTPGEVVLPLTSVGTEVLDLLLTRLRDLARKSREADQSIDEYHSIEQSLRQQLGARVAAMDSMGKDLSRMEEAVCNKDTRIAELEVGLARLKGATAQYARDVSELEALVQRMEREHETTTTERQHQQQEALAEQTSAVASLETRLSAAVAQTAVLQGQLAELRDAHAQVLEDERTSRRDEVATLGRVHEQALAARDAHAASLRADLDRVEETLRAAHDAARLLRAENAHLRAAKATADDRAVQVVGAIRAELERVVRMGEAFLGSAVDGKVDVASGAHVDGIGGGAVAGTGRSEVGSGSLANAGLAKRGCAPKKRRFDSGLGFLEEEEIVDGDV